VRIVTHDRLRRYANEKKKLEKEREEEEEKKEFPFLNFFEQND